MAFLDIYGANRDPAVWDRPEEFAPERFEDWSESASDFIPQGGNDFDTGHRCAGEHITIEIMKLAVTMLSRVTQ